MLTKTTKVGAIIFNHEFDTVSISMDTIILEDDAMISKSRHTTGFMPGEIDKVIAYLPDDAKALSPVIESRWTPEVIKKYREKMRAMHPEIHSHETK